MTSRDHFQLQPFCDPVIYAFCNYTLCCNEPWCCNFILEEQRQICAFKSPALQTPAVFPQIRETATGGSVTGRSTKQWPVGRLVNNWWADRSVISESTKCQLPTEVKDRYIPLRAHDVHILLTFNIHFFSLPFPNTVFKHIFHLQPLLTGTFEGWNQRSSWINSLKSRPLKTCSLNTEKD